MNKDLVSCFVRWIWNDCSKILRDLLILGRKVVCGQNKLTSLRQLRVPSFSISWKRSAKRTHTSIDVAIEAFYSFVMS